MANAELHRINSENFGGRSKHTEHQSLYIGKVCSLLKRKCKTVLPKSKFENMLEMKRKKYFSSFNMVFVKLIEDYNV